MAGTNPTGQLHMQRRFLVYCPAQNGRVQAELFGENRLFDVAINDFDGRLEMVPQEAEWKFADADFKFQSIARNLPQIARSYDFCAFLDNDIEVTTDQINQLFLIGETLGLQLFQPALTIDSDCSWPFLRRVPGRFLRDSKFIEIMTPFFGRQALELCLPTFSDTESAFGIDLLWAKIIQAGKAVIDGVVVRHARPMSSAHWQLKNGLTPNEELAALIAKHGMEPGDYFPTDEENAAGPEPLVSIILVVNSQHSAYRDAIDSVLRQTSDDWELLVVDTTPGYEVYCQLVVLATHHSGVLPIRVEGGFGIAGARNDALRIARGQFIAYLEEQDEFQPEHVTQIRHVAGSAEVLVFDYERVAPDAVGTDSRSRFSPASLRSELFVQPITEAIGLVHLRSLLTKTGGFCETLCDEQLPDFCSRLARCGARFSFVNRISGCRHVEPPREPSQPTTAQCQAMLANFATGQGLHGPPLAASVKGGVQKIAFVSPHCLIDFTNGAATTTLDALQTLAEDGFECEAFCGTRLDCWEESMIQEVLAKQGVDYEVRTTQIGLWQCRLLFTRQGRVPVTLFEFVSTRGGWHSEAEAEAFLSACETFLIKNRPDVVWTYGGDIVAQRLHRLVKRLDILLLFAIHNFLYLDRDMFRHVDYAIVPTEFARRFYWKQIGLACHLLPLVVNPVRVQVTERTPRYLTFVNPEPRKGVHIFARISQELNRIRPDIPILLVEGASKSDALTKLGVPQEELASLHVIPNTPDARKFYAITKVLLMPSLEENAALVATEAMLNGIPVVASDRGGLPETIGSSADCLALPERITVNHCEIPATAEIGPWISAIEHLWDNENFYREQSEMAQTHATNWLPHQRIATYRAFFRLLQPQPVGPLIPTGLSSA